MESSNRSRAKLSRREIEPLSRTWTIAAALLLGPLRFQGGFGPVQSGEGVENHPALLPDAAPLADQGPLAEQGRGEAEQVEAVLVLLRYPFLETDGAHEASPS